MTKPIHFEDNKIVQLKTSDGVALTKVESATDKLRENICDLAYKSQSASPMQLQGNFNLDQEIEKTSDKLDQEFSKPVPDPGEIDRLIRMLVILLLRRDRNLEQEFCNRVAGQLRIQANEIKDSFRQNATVQIVITCTAASLMIGGGASGFASTFAAKDSAMQAALSIAAKSSAPIGELLSKGTSIIDLRYQGERFVLQFELEEAKRHRDQGQQTSQGNDGNIRDARQSEKDAEQSRTTTIGTILR